MFFVNFSWRKSFFFFDNRLHTKFTNLFLLRRITLQHVSNKLGDCNEVVLFESNTPFGIVSNKLLLTSRKSNFNLQKLHGKHDNWAAFISNLLNSVRLPILWGIDTSGLLFNFNVCMVRKFDMFLGKYRI